MKLSTLPQRALGHTAFKVIAGLIVFYFIAQYLKNR